MASHFSNLNSLLDFLNRNKEGTSDIKITSIHKDNFNTYEGYQYHIGIKVFTTPKYNNKQFMWETNSTYIFDYLPDKELTEKEEKEAIIDGLQEVFSSSLE